MTWPNDYGRHELAEVGSTLDTGLQLAGAELGDFWVLAHKQTSARGRRGRHWSMPDGNFAATLVLAPEGTPAEFALRSFVMSLALFRSFVELTGQNDAFALKWPNDVLLNGGKVAGILLESGRAGRLAIGVGVNLVAAPAVEDVEPLALRPVSLLQETDVRVAPSAFLDVLACHYAALEAQFRAFGFAPIRAGWLAHAARIGDVITARTGREEITGVFEDVDGTGQLVLRAPRGVRVIPAADVYF